MSSKKLNILAINYSSPPMASARSIQVSRLLQGLGADTILICGKDPREAIDRTIAPDLEKNLRLVIRVPHSRPLPLRAADVVSNRLGLHIDSAPDVYKGWAMKAAAAAIGVVRGGFRPDVIITFGTPMSTHLIGPRLKKAAACPWIAHLSDPWSDNPYRRNNALTAWMNLRMERSVIEGADAVAFTSPETVELVMKKYDAGLRGRAHYLPHCFEPCLFDYSAQPPRDRYIIRSVGSFYGNRTPAPFYRAVEEIAANRPELIRDVDIEITGSLFSYRNEIEKYPAAGKIVKISDSVPYSDGLNLMRNAHCLLIVDAPAELSVFFPSKLVEYLGARRFVFAITPDGTTARIVKDAGGRTANPPDAAAVRAALEEILEKRPFESAGETGEYETENVCARMREIINGLL